MKFDALSPTGISRLISFLKFFADKLYKLMKHLPSKNKVVFLSRQNDKPGLDFLLLRDELLRRDPSVQIVMITKRLEKNLSSIIRFVWYTFVSLYHLATSSVCVLDSYWPVVSMLQHKESLTVIQMWHAIGKMKQSGYQTLGKKYGRKEDIAEAMDMHKGYDVVIAGANSMNDYYCASFGVEKEQLLNIGLPRIDYLLENRKSNRDLLLTIYPQLKGKTIVLYAPTFRRGVAIDYSNVVKAFPTDKYALIVKPHPNQSVKNKEALLPYMYSNLPTIAVLDACDIVITDFSAISFEAAVLNKPIYFYLYDYEDYLATNGVNINPYEEMPNSVFKSLNKLIKAITTKPYDMEALQGFRQRYLPAKMGQSTKRLTTLILDCIKEGKQEGLRKNLNR